MSNNEIKFMNLLEEPPAGSGKLKPFNTNSRVQNIKDWLIHKLAGDRMIILNAHIRVIPRESDTTIVGKLAYSKGGSLIHGSSLFCDDVHMLQLTNETELNK